MSTPYLDPLTSLNELFVDYPMRAEMSSIHIAAQAGRTSVVVRLLATDPMVAAAGIVEWRRTLARGRSWVWRTPDGTQLHISTTGHSPECADFAIAVLAGPVPDSCRLDHDLEPGTAEELDDEALYRRLGDEVANNWPFPAGTNPQNGDTE